MTGAEHSKGAKTPRKLERLKDSVAITRITCPVWSIGICSARYLRCFRIFDSDYSFSFQRLSFSFLEPLFSFSYLFSRLLWLASLSQKNPGLGFYRVLKSDISHLPFNHNYATYPSQENLKHVRGTHHPTDLSQAACKGQVTRKEIALCNLVVSGSSDIAFCTHDGRVTYVPVFSSTRKGARVTQKPISYKPRSKESRETGKV